MGFFRQFFSRVIPAATIATCCGIGFFPEWQRYWAAVLAMVLSGIIVYFSGVFKQGILAIAIPLTIFGIIFFILGLISVLLYRVRRDDIEDKLVIDAFVGQIFVLALSMPAIIEISDFSMWIFHFICSSLFNCAEWFYILCRIMLAFAIPYVTFLIFEICNIWPGRWLATIHNNTWATMSVGLSNAFYSITILYGISFIFLDLQLPDVIDFFYNLFFNAIFSIDLWYKYIIEFYNYLANSIFWNIMEKNRTKRDIRKLWNIRKTWYRHYRNSWSRN